MLDLTEVILNDGKVIHREVTLELTSLKYRFGDFQIQKATPVELTIENIGERKLSVNGKVHLTVCIPCARCLEPTASGLDIQFEHEVDVKCSKCGALMLPHRVCKACGTYNKKEIIPVED